MKKCASCTKDLPDAALHCVFCGAKQAPAPAQPAGMAKTVMGYGANEELNRLREQAAAQNAARSNPPPAITPPATFNTPASSPSANSGPAAMPAPARPNSPSTPPVAGYAPGALAPMAGAQAPTMFAGPAPAAIKPAGFSPTPGPAFSPSPAPSSPASPAPVQQPAGLAGFTPTPGPLSSPSPHGPGPSGYNPQPVGSSGYNPQPASATPPYMAQRSSAQPSRPIEPWKDKLRTTMFIWGGVLIACFAVPISLSPLVGNWNFVIDGEGLAKLGPLILAAVGILSLVVGAIPMASAPRGLIAAVLGLAGIFVPMFLLGDIPPWKSLLSVGGTVLLVPALLVRNEYTESPLPRILITIGALAALAPFVIPENGNIPLVALFTFLVEAPGSAKVGIGLFIAYILLLVLTLLAWMPAPATAGAKVLAWILMLFPLILQGAGIALSGGEGIDFERSLNPLVLGWAYGAAGPGSAGMQLGGMMLGTAYMAIASYGLASVIGKKLEG